MAPSPEPVNQGEAVLVELGPRGPAVVGGPRSPFLRADDLGALRGDGVFEHFLVVDGQPRHLDEHLCRLAASAAMVDLALPAPEEWKAAVEGGARAWRGPGEWAMRLVCTRGPERGGPPCAYALGQELAPAVLRQRREGIAVLTLERGLRKGLAPEAPWLLLGAKTLSYAVNMAAKRWAQANGADDAIFVGTDGAVWEGGNSAVVASFGRRLVSPPTSVGILDSISVRTLFVAAESAGWEVARAELCVADLFAAEGLWLSSSLRFARVHTLDGKGLAPCPAHEVLASLAANC
ncbi:MAG: aminotransferase class IV [Acidimicrobiales bacterium]